MHVKQRESFQRFTISAIPVTPAETRTPKNQVPQEHKRGQSQPALTCSPDCAYAGRTRPHISRYAPVSICKLGSLVTMHSLVEPLCHPARGQGHSAEKWYNWPRPSTLQTSLHSFWISSSNQAVTHATLLQLWLCQTQLLAQFLINSGIILNIFSLLASR